MDNDELIYKGYDQDSVISGDIKVTEDRIATFVFASDDLDRKFDRIDIKGLDIKNYLNNRVVLWKHDLAKPIGKTIDLRYEGNKLIGVIKLFDADHPEFGTLAEGVYQMLKEGVGALSIGFKALKARPNESGGLDISKGELMEASIVTVPCNQAARLISVDGTPPVQEPINIKKEVTHSLSRQRRIKLIRT
jgi:HK97 family phage prohead protease